MQKLLKKEIENTKKPSEGSIREIFDKNINLVSNILLYESNQRILTHVEKIQQNLRLMADFDSIEEVDETKLQAEFIDMSSTTQEQPHTSNTSYYELFLDKRSNSEEEKEIIKKRIESINKINKRVPNIYKLKDMKKGKKSSNVYELSL